MNFSANPIFRRARTAVFTFVLGVSAGACFANGELTDFGHASTSDPAEIPLWIAGAAILVLRQKVLRAYPG